MLHFFFTQLSLFTLFLSLSSSKIKLTRKACFWKFNIYFVRKEVFFFSLCNLNQLYTMINNSLIALCYVMQFITFGFACTPLYFVWEKAIGLHDCKSMCKRAAARLPVVVPIWFLAIIFPFFGPINSAVGSLLVSFTVYIIPALAHMFTFRSAAAREVMDTLILYSIL